MKLTKAKVGVKLKVTLISKFRSLKPGSDECVVLETAQEYRNFAGIVGKLNREKMRFKTTCGGGVVNVWRIE